MKATQILLVVATLFVFSSNSIAQLKISVNSFPDDEAANVMFRGFNNVLEITSTVEGLEYTIESTNVVSTLVDTPKDPNVKLPANVKRYLIKIGNEKEVVFKFHKKGEKGIFQTVRCQVSNMPDPPIHLGGVPSNSKIPNTVNEISCKYSRKFRFKGEYTITQVSMFVADQVLSSEDGELTDEMKKAVGMLVSGESFSVNCRVLGVDGITRLMGGSFTIE